MGSSTSKVATKAPRRFPSRVPEAVSAGPRTAQASQTSSPVVSMDKTDAIAVDGMRLNSVSDSYSQRLHKMGIVDPNPTYSPSSTTPKPVSGNPARPSPRPSGTTSTMSALDSRNRLQKMATAEFEGLGRREGGGRQLLDIGTVAHMLVMRERGCPLQDIENSLNLKPGVVRRLGTLGVVGSARID